jgi:hypothetical protein
VSVETRLCCSLVLDTLFCVGVVFSLVAVCGLAGVEFVMRLLFVASYSRLVLKIRSFY